MITIKLKFNIKYFLKLSVNTILVFPITSRHLLDIRIGDQRIKIAIFVQHLTVLTIDVNLFWSIQDDITVQNINKSLFFLRRVKYLIKNVNTLLTMNHSYIESII